MLFLLKLFLRITIRCYWSPPIVSEISIFITVLSDYFTNFHESYEILEFDFHRQNEEKLPKTQLKWKLY